MPRPSVPGALLAAFSVVCLVPLVVTVGADGWWQVPAALAALSLLGAGMLLWRPGTRGEALALVLAGDFVALASLNTDLFAGLGGWWLQLGWTLQWVPVPLVATVLLSHPGGLLALRRHRVLLALTWAWAAGLQLVISLLWDPRFDGYAGPARWYHVYASERAVDVLGYVSIGFLTVLVGWFVVEFVQRWRSARGLARTATRWVAAAGIVLAVGLLARHTLPVAVAHHWVAGTVADAVELGHQVLVAVAVFILVGVGLRGALRTGAAAERVLRAGGDPQTIEEILREELHDPSLTLAFVVDEHALSASGEPLGVGAAATTGARVRRTLVSADGGPMVEADLDPSVEADPALVRAALTAAGVALENGRLTVERAAHLAEISASRTRIVESGLAQRRALERDLHDGAQQYLLAASATLTRVEHAEGPEAVASAIADARGQLSTAMAELRRLARGVHPAALSQNGLAAGLASLADLAGDVELTLHGPVAHGERLDPAVESTAYFLVAEAVANARKHAPGARVSVTVTEKPDELAIRVDDDGPGGATMQPGGGLSGLADRVRALGGRLEIRSTAGGSTVAATFPCGRRDR